MPFELRQVRGDFVEAKSLAAEAAFFVETIESLEPGMGAVVLCVRRGGAIGGSITGAYLPAVGADNCDSRYKSEKCVPVAPDVDCSGRDGDRPEYVSGPFKYEGSDPYRLDRDKDGIACEPHEDF
jgi:hypothetical protein